MTPLLQHNGLSLAILCEPRHWQQLHVVRHCHCRSIQPEMALKHFVIQIFLSIFLTMTAAEQSGRVKRAGILFPPTATMGLFFAIAVPVDLPQYELSMSYNFEANYVLPTNATELALRSGVTEVRYARSLTRNRVYDVLEDRLEREGTVGRTCLLKAVCETAAVPITGQHNGLLGELVHLVLTPSSSEDEGISPQFLEAEKIGKDKGRDGCASSYGDCVFDLYQLFSVWGNENEN